MKITIRIGASHDEVAIRLHGETHTFDRSKLRGYQRHLFNRHIVAMFKMRRIQEGLNAL